MANTVGALVQLTMAREATYGVTPAGGAAWHAVPAVSLNLTEGQRLTDSNLLGQGQQALRPSREPADNTGSATLPVDQRAIGYWLTMCYGLPTTSAVTGGYQHVFTSNNATLASYSIERWHPDTGLSVLYKGVRASNIAWTFDPTGSAEVEVGLMFQSVVRGTASVAGAFATVAVDRFTQYDNQILKDDTALGKITAARIPFDLNLETVRYLGGAGAIGDINPGMRTASGSLTARFSDWSLFTLADNATVFGLELNWSASGTDAPRLRLLFDQVELGKGADPVQGGGGISATFPLVASKDPGSGLLMTAQLRNDVAVYTS